MRLLYCFSTLSQPWHYSVVILFYRFAFEASYVHAIVPLWQVIGSEPDDQDQIDGYSCGVIAAFKVYFHRLNGRLPKKQDFDSNDLRDFRVFMASTIMSS